MGACMLVRNDNHLLFEWVAYHYTVLPLRFLIVGSDDNSTEDPTDVLGRWNGTNLQYEVWHFGDEFGKGINYRFNDLTYRHTRRQQSFLSACLKYSIKHNRSWVALIDSDEYIQLNPLDDAEDEQFYKNSTTNPQHQQIYELESGVLKSMRYLSANETLWGRIHTRKMLRDNLRSGRRSANDSFDLSTLEIPTVMEVLEDYSSRHGTLPCFTMARVRYGAVKDQVAELATNICHPTLNPDVISSLNVSGLSTIQLFYHADPAFYELNRWAKVLLDLRRIHLQQVSRIKNPHVPIRQVCAGNFIHHEVSLLRVNHYLSRFNVRKGDPRNLQDIWSTFAHVRNRTSCGHIQGWLNAFCDQFGIDAARYMLGMD